MDIKNLILISIYLLCSIAVNSNVDLVCSSSNALITLPHRVVVGINKTFMEELFFDDILSAIRNKYV